MQPQAMASSQGSVRFRVLQHVYNKGLVVSVLFQSHRADRPRRVLRTRKAAYEVFGLKSRSRPTTQILSDLEHVVYLIANCCLLQSLRRFVRRCRQNLLCSSPSISEIGAKLRVTSSASDYRSALLDPMISTWTDFQSSVSLFGADKEG